MNIRMSQRRSVTLDKARSQNTLLAASEEQASSRAPVGHLQEGQPPGAVAGAASAVGSVVQEGDEEERPLDLDQKEPLLCVRTEGECGAPGTSTQPLLSPATAPLTTTAQEAGPPLTQPATSATTSRTTAAASASAPVQPEDPGPDDAHQPLLADEEARQPLIPEDARGAAT